MNTSKSGILIISLLLTWNLLAVSNAQEGEASTEKLPEYGKRIVDEIYETYPAFTGVTGETDRLSACFIFCATESKDGKGDAAGWVMNALCEKEEFSASAIKLLDMYTNRIYNEYSDYDQVIFLAEKLENRAAESNKEAAGRIAKHHGMALAQKYNAGEEPEFLPKAEESLKKALEWNGEQSEAWLFYAICAMANTDHTAALERLEKALAMASEKSKDIAQQLYDAYSSNPESMGPKLVSSFTSNQ